MLYACHHRYGRRLMPRRPQDPHASLAKQILRIADDVHDAIARAQFLGPKLDHADPAGLRTFCFQDGSILRICGSQLEAYASPAELERSAAAGSRLNGVVAS